MTGNAGVAPRVFAVLGAGLTVQVALLILVAAVPGVVGEAALSPVGVLMWLISLAGGPAANSALTRRWIRGGGPLGAGPTSLWTVRACAVGLAMWIASAVVLLALVLLVDLVGGLVFLVA
ncbi:hypothetical protein [Kitasatospora paranensis]|uniref:Uncharacterized protein n=1 Tax=Kitasatospora paranensis TaxID=258053 RepID=A0ABW2FUF2_9ACTN